MDKKAKVDAALASAHAVVGRRCQAASKPVPAPPASVLGIIRSPVLEGYRNKSEMTIGLGVDGEQVEVGFLLGATANGITAVADATPTRHTSPTSIAFAHIVRDFIRKQSRLPAWDKRVTPSVGFWRLLTVREGRATTFLPAAGAPPGVVDSPTIEALRPMDYLVVSDDARSSACLHALGPAYTYASNVTEDEPEAPPPDEVLVMVQVSPAFTDEATMMDEARALAKYVVSKAASQRLPLTSLMLQLHDGLSNAAPPDAKMIPLMDGHGNDEGHIHESLCELRFRVHPAAFFQVNTAACCLLYKQVCDFVSPGGDGRTLLLDLCCGTGTIGLTMARSVAKVVGIDMVESAIVDARHNAQLNGLTNCEYVAGKAEDVLPDVLARHAPQYDHVACVADPPRAGLHASVVRLILMTTQLKRLVYVSCNVLSLADNLADLCGPTQGSNKYRVPAHVPRFSVTKAVALDLFPHTPHVESVVVLERS